MIFFNYQNFELVDVDDTALFLVNVDQIALFQAVDVHLTALFIMPQ